MDDIIRHSIGINGIKEMTIIKYVLDKNKNLSLDSQNPH